MTIVALTILALALIGFCGWREAEHRSERTDLRESVVAEREAWLAERKELLTRVQRPELIPLPERPDIPDEEYREFEADDIDLVGTVQLNGNNED